MARRWSSLKQQIEALFAPGLDLQIHCTHYSKYDCMGIEPEVRYWMVLDKRILWDCPSQFWEHKQPKLGKPIVYWEDMLWRSPVGSCIAETIRLYLLRPRDQLFEPIERDDWLLGDMLRAADRRIGRVRLSAFARSLSDGNPARKVLERRQSNVPLNRLPSRGDRSAKVGAVNCMNSRIRLT